jgi:Tfp pilus assembly PilM family ATPase
MAFSFGRMKTAALGHFAGGTLPIAIDFGVSSLKILQIEGGDTPSLIAAAAAEVPDGIRDDAAKRFAWQFQALPKVIRAAGFKGRRAVCAIPAAQMFCKHMQFPRSDGVDLKSLVEAAVPQHLECMPETLIYRHVLVEGASPQGAAPGSKSEVICLAAARDLVSRMMQTVRDARLECVGMQPEFTAALAAFGHVNRRAEDATTGTLYLDLAHGTTKVMIGHGSNLVFAKSIPMAGRELDSAVARTLDMDIPAARARRLASAELVTIPAPGPKTPCAAGLAMIASGGQRARSIGSEQADAESETATAEEERRSGMTPIGFTTDIRLQPAAPVIGPEFDLTDQLEILTDEIAGCMRYYEAIFPGKRVQRAIFVGGESRHRGLCQHIARRLRLPAQVADPLARMARTGKEPCAGVDFSQPQPGWAVAFGLSLCPTDL